MAKQFHLDLTKKSREFSNEMPRLTRRIANISKNFFLSNFKVQGFQDGGLQRWKERKKNDHGRAILVKSGDLRRSIQVVRMGSSFFVIGSDLPYAAIHNYGGEINKDERGGHILSFSKKGRFAKQRTEAQRARTSYQQKVTIGAHSIKMPKRKFIGNSKDLRKLTLNEMNKTFRKIFK